MSDVETSGFPAVALTGSSVGNVPAWNQPTRGHTHRAIGAWECLQLALAKPTDPPGTAKWAHHAVDALRVILGLDTLYASERR